ncbi:MAG: vitamin K epoxide reductase [Chloroflexota bacterium]|nr:vitamin K epoxide reductase [Chloroflexota bacterium]
MSAEGDPNVPPGWKTNPTARTKRHRLACLASVGFVVSTYLTLYQLDVLGDVWDPLFGRGSRQVLTLLSPVPDAALGVFAYSAEVLLSFVGADDRWRSAPWAALAFGLLVTAGAVTSLVLIALQAFVATAWCTLCLVSALISLSLFAFGNDEARAAWAHLRRVREAGGSLLAAMIGSPGRLGERRTA